MISSSPAVPPAADRMSLSTITRVPASRRPWASFVPPGGPLVTRRGCLPVYVRCSRGSVRDQCYGLHVRGLKDLAARMIMESHSACWVRTQRGHSRRFYRPSRRRFAHLLRPPCLFAASDVFIWHLRAAVRVDPALIKRFPGLRMSTSTPAGRRSSSTPSEPWDSSACFRL